MLATDLLTETVTSRKQWYDSLKVPKDNNGNLYLCSAKFFFKSEG